MITWMQKHKKWLVITIWISAIAFIGSGGIFWGAGGFNFNSDKAAVVGDVKISMSEYYSNYQQLYQQEANKAQGDFDEVRAKEMGLHILALQQLIAAAQWQSFALDLGLQVSDDELFEVLTQRQEFQVNGVFDNEHYKKVLQSVGLRSENYEEQLRREILVQKALYGFSFIITPPTKTEELSLAVPAGIQDRFEIKVLNPPHIDVSDDEIKKYWEKNMSKWLTPEQYTIEYIEVSATQQKASQEDIQKRYEINKSAFADEDGNIPPLETIIDEITKAELQAQAWKSASRSYAPFQDGEIKGKIIDFKLTSEDTLHIQDIVLSADNIKVLTNAHKGQVLKPIEQEDGYILIKILEKSLAHPKSYEEAKDEVKTEVIALEQKKHLEEMAQKELEGFSGVDIGFWSPYNVSQEQIAVATKLGVDIFGMFGVLHNAFTSEHRSGYAPIGDKMLLYRITQQRLELQNLQDLQRDTAFIKEQIYMTLFQEYLNKHYPPKIFMQFD